MDSGVLEKARDLLGRGGGGCGLFEVPADPVGGPRTVFAMWTLVPDIGARHIAPGRRNFAFTAVGAAEDGGACGAHGRFTVEAEHDLERELRRVVASHFREPDSLRHTSPSIHLREFGLLPRSGSQERWPVTPLLPGTPGRLARDMSNLGSVPEQDAWAAIAELFEGAGLAEVKRRLPMGVLGKLGHLREFGARTTRFYGVPGPVGDRRREALSAFPCFAEMFVACEGLGRALDEGRDLRPALAQAVREVAKEEVAIPPSLLGWMRQAEVTNVGLAPKAKLLAFLAKLPPNWLPRGGEDIMACSSLSRLHDQMRGITPDPRVLFAEAGRMGWGALEEAVFKGLRQSNPGANWLTRVLQEVPVHFVDTFIMPLKAHHLGDGGVASTDKDVLAAQTILFGGRSLLSCVKVDAEWHALLQDVRSNLGKKDDDLKAMTWKPLSEPFAADGVTLVPLADGELLAEEGTRGPDRNGVRGLNHCVATYTPKCLTGEVHIVSLRRLLPNGGYERLSTAELLLSPHSGKVTCRQHRAWANGDPGTEARAALQAYVTAINDRRHPITPGLTSRRPDERRSMDEVRRKCGFDWRDPSALAKRIAAFEPLLPPEWRGLDVEEWGRRLGHVPEPGAALAASM